MDAGLNADVTPAGRPDTLRAIAELNPPETAVVMVLVPLAPWRTDTDAGDAAKVNAGGTLTVSETAAVCVSPPPAPVTTTEYVPAVVADPTVSVRIEEPEPGAAM